MAKTTAPLLSFGSGGQIAKTQVYSQWRGVPYARRYTVPANPRTSAQTQTRGVFSWLNETWKLLDVAVQAPWTLASKGRPLTDRNLYIKSNLSGLRGSTAVPATDLSAMLVSPGAAAGFALSSISTMDDGSHGLTVSAVPPTLPSGWSVTTMNFVAFVQQSAIDGTDYTSYYGSDNSDPYSYNFANIGAGTYAAFAFATYQKPDGSTAYSPSLYAQQVVA